MPPHKIKASLVANTLEQADDDTSNAKLDTHDAVVNLIQDEQQADITDIEDIAQPVVEKVKKSRAPKKKKEEPPIVVSEDDEEPIVIEINPELKPEVVEDKKQDALLQLLRQYKNFNYKKYPDSFAYFTEIIKRSMFFTHKKMNKQKTRTIDGLFNI